MLQSIFFIYFFPVIFYTEIILRTKTENIFKLLSLLRNFFVCVKYKLARAPSICGCSS